MQIRFAKIKAYFHWSTSAVRTEQTQPATNSPGSTERQDFFSEQFPTASASLWKCLLRTFFFFSCFWCFSGMCTFLQTRWQCEGCCPSSLESSHLSFNQSPVLTVIIRTPSSHEHQSGSLFSWLEGHVKSLLSHQWEQNNSLWIFQCHFVNHERNDTGLWCSCYQERWHQRVGLKVREPRRTSVAGEVPRLGLACRSCIYMRYASQLQLLMLLFQKKESTHRKECAGVGRTCKSCSLFWVKYHVTHHRHYSLFSVTFCYRRAHKRMHLHSGHLLIYFVLRPEC